MAEFSNGSPTTVVWNTPKTLTRSERLGFSFQKILKWDQNATGRGIRKIAEHGLQCYLSPVDRIRIGKYERAEALGWTGWKNSSFECNQSFPRISKPRIIRDEINLDTPLRKKMERIRGDGLNTCSFSAGRCRGSFSVSRFPESSGAKLAQPVSDAACNTRPLQGISDSAWSFSSSFISAVGGVSTSYPIAPMNPNKAVFTIDMKTSQILVVNGVACNLLGYNPDELCQVKLTQLLCGRHKNHVTALAEEQLELKDGNMVFLSGKVVEMVTKDERIVPVSLWLRKLETDARCLAVAEPVERRVANIVIDDRGYIISADTEAGIIFQYEEEQLQGTDISSLIPSLKVPCPEEVMPKDVKKQKATGRTREGATFPVCIRISEEAKGDGEADSGIRKCYKLTIWVFANMSGLVVLAEDGVVESCNHHFTHMMFGYPQSELIGQKITNIIPNFCEDLEYPGPLQHLDGAKDGDDDNSNYDSAVENVDPDRSCSSSAVYESDCSAVCSKDCSNREKLELKNLASCDNIFSINENKDIINGNSSTDMPEVIDSLNRLNLGLVNDICGEARSSTVTVDDHSIFPVNESISDIGSNLVLNEVMRKEKVVPPCTLSLPARDQNAVTDAENNSDNGELTPIVSPHMDFMEEEDNFQTASDDEDSIEILPAVITEACIHQKGANLIDSCQGTCNTPAHISYSAAVQKSANSLQLNVSSNEALPVSENNFNVISIENVCRCNAEGEIHADLSGVSRSVGGESNLCQQCPKMFDSANIPCDNLTSTPATGKRFLRRVISRDAGITHTEVVRQVEGQQFPDGSYFGYGRHKDGSNLDIVYRVRAVVLVCGRLVYCVWISRDPEEIAEGGRTCGNLTLTSSFNSTVDNSLGQAIRSCAQTNISHSRTRSGSVSVLSQCEDEQTSGEYGERYTTLQQIGKGAYGYVKMAFRNEDGLLVITKFIQKHKVHQQSWVEDPSLGSKVPLEISLLTTLNHPNIVKVLDVFENPKFFQLVMEKHGAGMDLFEFIDRKPYLDETLNSYIFRQIVSAVDYLHSLQILHRDIKDENIIINEKFHAKLIDFGSATFMSEGRLFSTFYGTVEYCSPEVLAGNKYEGPELEMWSLGVTLYVMTFGENPFFDVEEIMKAELHPPSSVSEELMELLHWMLEKNPRERCTVKQLVEHPWISKEVDMTGYNFQDIVSCYPQEAHPPVYYSEYRCDSANDSLSNRFPVTESSSALLSNHDDDSNADDRTVGSSNSLGSLTTVENFGTEEDVITSVTENERLAKIQESLGCVQNITEVSVERLSKVLHTFEENLVDVTSNIAAVEGGNNVPETEHADDDDWDPDYYYDEQDSFS
ncbi:PAS domain-containing serine/threonine-protein kinase isoform X2 [Schistocerca serialis cubense]|uniref:PAS domain-containing serine/threonine-protein kinase isoform X2 n=1 Tax=Schistocerca serialis cubense TaxID=2023355 RepID=UPI00214EEE62|nr:PAS domain-containing serine/threonine-protein kinase isoform X2 [Schistocerca serialis cubense]